MIDKVYIRGVENRGKEVITELQMRGGINKNRLDGSNPKSIYFICDTKTIGYATNDTSSYMALLWSGEEIFISPTSEEVIYSNYKKKLYKKLDNTMYFWNKNRQSAPILLNYYIEDRKLDLTTWFEVKIILRKSDVYTNTFISWFEKNFCTSIVNILVDSDDNLALKFNMFYTNIDALKDVD